jgi:hypothetical protein
VSISSFGEAALEKPAIERQSSIQDLASAKVSALTPSKSTTPEVLLYDKYLSK